MELIGDLIRLEIQRKVNVITVVLLTWVFCLIDYRV